MALGKIVRCQLTPCLCNTRCSLYICHRVTVLSICHSPDSRTQNRMLLDNRAIITCLQQGFVVIKGYRQHVWKYYLNFSMTWQQFPNYKRRKCDILAELRFVCFFSICFNCPVLIRTWCFCTCGLLSVHVLTNHVQGGLHHNLRKRKWWTQCVDSNLPPAVHRKPIELSVSEQMKLDEASVSCARSIFNLRISICCQW